MLSSCPQIIYFFPTRSISYLNKTIILCTGDLKHSNVLIIVIFLNVQPDICQQTLLRNISILKKKEATNDTMMLWKRVLSVIPTNKYHILLSYVYFSIWGDIYTFKTNQIPRSALFSS